MPPKPAKRNSQTVATASQSEEMAGSLSDPAILRQRRAFPATLALATTTAFIGPIPPPELLAEYERTLPGLADRLVAIAEREATTGGSCSVAPSPSAGLAAGFASR